MIDAIKCACVLIM